jgi:signal transduction histidine kinase
MSPPDVLSLLVHRGPDAGRWFPLPAGEPQLIGRSSESLPLRDRRISRRHAELTPDGDGWVLRDLRSRNGTRVGDRMLEGSARIAVGDRFTCGDSEFEVVAGRPTSGDLSEDRGLGRGPSTGTTDQERLVAAGRAVAGLSHSIKNILQAMRGGADAVELAIGRDDLESARAGWPILARNLDRIHTLTLNLLAFAHDRPLDREPTLLPPLLREIAELLGPAAARRRASIEVECDRDLPEPSIDLGAVHQALMNLLINAIEAVPERTGRVVLAARRGGPGEVLLQVDDNGPGLPESVRGRPFEPFVSTKGQRGTGLGLAVSRRLAVRHGGELRSEDLEGGGTRMELRLPIEGDDASDRTRGPESVPETDLGLEF